MKIKFKTIQQLVEQYGVTRMTGISVTLKGYETYMITEYMQKYILTDKFIQYSSKCENGSGWIFFNFLPSEYNSQSCGYYLHEDWIDNDVRVEYNDVMKMFLEPL